jgi:hypothetical protein
MVRRIRIRKIELVFTVLFLSALSLGILAFSPLASADVNNAEHGGSSNCYICHTVEDPSDPACMKCHYDFYGETYNPMAHKIVEGLAYTTCGEGHCHWNYVEALNASVHQSLDCGSCHSPLHVSLYEDGLGGWLFVNRLNNSGAILAKPVTPISLNQTVFYFDSANDTSSLGASILNWGGEVHWAWTNVSGYAAGIGSSTRYLTCLNCHFLTTNPAEAGLIKWINGMSFIAIPEFTLSLAPHDLSESKLRDTEVIGNEIVSITPSMIGITSGLIVGLGIIGLILFRRRSEWGKVN